MRLSDNRRNVNVVSEERRERLIEVRSESQEKFSAEQAQGQRERILCDGTRNVENPSLRNIEFNSLSSHFFLKFILAVMEIDLL